MKGIDTDVPAKIKGPSSIKMGKGGWIEALLEAGKTAPVESNIEGIRYRPQDQAAMIEQQKKEGLIDQATYDQIHKELLFQTDQATVDRISKDLSKRMTESDQERKD